MNHLKMRMMTGRRQPGLTDPMLKFLIRNCYDLNIFWVVDQDQLLILIIFQMIKFLIWLCRKQIFMQIKLSLLVGYQWLNQKYERFRNIDYNEIPYLTKHWTVLVYWSRFSSKRDCRRDAYQTIQNILRSLHLNDNSQQPARGSHDFDKLYKL